MGRKESNQTNKTSVVIIFFKVEHSLLHLSILVDYNYTISQISCVTASNLF